MARKPELGNVQIYPQGPLKKSDKRGYVLKFYCPIQGQRIRRSCGTRDRREARSVMRECQERLLNGEYVKSGGAITKADEKAMVGSIYLREREGDLDAITWDQACEEYRRFKESRVRKRSFDKLSADLVLAEKIFESRRAADGSVSGATLTECTSRASLEFLQNQLLCGVEGRYGYRQATTVNSIMGEVMAFVRYCYEHEWISKVPILKDLGEKEVMKGRAITGEEFDRMIACVPRVVGQSAAPSWAFLLKVLWESGFRIADVLNFYWDDETKIHPRWAGRRSEHSTVVIPSTQKNGKCEEIPMLPGLEALLRDIPESERTGRVIMPAQVEFATGKKDTAFCPTEEDLEGLIADYSNCAIADACNVSEQAVRKWLRRFGMERNGPIRHYGEAIPSEIVEGLKARSAKRKPVTVDYSKDRVGRVISAIGKEAGVVVRQPDVERGIRIKYASAHDLRRSLAERLYNRGISAETLMVIMRHADFATTRKFYQAKKRTQSAAAEVHAVLGVKRRNSELVGPLVGPCEQELQLSDDEVRKLKYLLRTL